MIGMELFVKNDYQAGSGGKIIINAMHNNTSNTWSNFTAYIDGHLPGIAVYANKAADYEFYISGLATYSTVNIQKILTGDTVATKDLSGTTIAFVSALPAEANRITATLHYGLTNQNFTNHIDSRYVLKSGDTMTGQLKTTNIILTSTTNGSQTAASTPAVRIGDNDSAIHMIIDRDAINAKATSTTAGTLMINESGGLVKIGSGGLESGGKILVKCSQSNSNQAHVSLIEAQNTIADPGNAFFSGITMLAPNLTRASTAHIFLFGKARSTKNSGYIGYNWSSNSANANYITLGHYGVDNIVAITGAGNVGIGNVSPSYKLDVNGSVRTGSSLTVHNSGGGDASLTFDRNANAGWRFINSNGTLYTQCNYTTAKGDYYTVMSLEYNTKKADFVGDLNAKTLSVDNKAKFVYNSTDKCVDLIFI